MTKTFTLREVDDHPESSMSTTTPPLEIDHRIPPSPPPLHEDPDLRRQPNLNLSLGPSPPSPPPPLEQQPPPLPNHFLPIPPIYFPEPQPAVAPLPRRNRRRNPKHGPREGKPKTIEPPFPWSTDHRAQVHSLKNLIDKGINTISGDVQCKRCEQVYQIEYNLQEKFLKVGGYLAENMHIFDHRAPAHWMNPTLGKCNYCHQENSVKPKISEKKNSINWLFLLLGEMIGCCTLEQLKYFCKHAEYHRTGAKNRLVFLTYLGICKQLDPHGPFNLIF
ncbi:hypothetical protein L6452_00971 [Arctium lappa]|uniref:Uncharacterized protein n=1 Tax=Arctium lappa TaxID=4217 RepID=A0ACB9FGU2_ARCLA|nr:hypothetical protein L6452_00971 [Arctium lappa]